MEFVDRVQAGVVWRRDDRTCTKPCPGFRTSDCALAVAHSRERLFGVVVFMGKLLVNITLGFHRPETAVCETYVRNWTKQFETLISCTRTILI